MAQLTASKKRIYELIDGECFNDLDLAAVKVFDGSAVGVVVGTGLHRQLVAADKFAGFADESIDNSAGAAQAKRVRVRERGRLKVTGVTVALTDIGAKVYMSDGDTFTLTAGSNSHVGWIHRVITTTEWILAFDVNDVRAAA